MTTVESDVILKAKMRVHLEFLCAFVAVSSAVPSAQAQFVQQGGKLVGAGNWLGGSNFTALSGDGNTAIIGNLTDGSGSATVYFRSGGAWTQQGPKLVGSGTIGKAYFGASVALSADGNTALIGAFEDNYGIGAAWVFTRSNGNWTQQGAKLIGTGYNCPDTGNRSGCPNQGDAVALSGDGNTAMISGIDATYTGAVWVFVRSAGVWAQQGNKLAATGTGSTVSCFGSSVALSGDGNTALVGSSGYFTLSGPNGSNAGAAWVFTRSGGVWSQQGGRLVGTSAVGPASLGDSAALSSDGNTAIVGGWTDNGGIGAAWVFTRSNGVWTQQGGKLVGMGTDIDGYNLSCQGLSVGISGDASTSIVGAPCGGYPGGAFIFTRTGGMWKQNGLLVSSDYVVQGTSPFEGDSVALSSDGTTAIVGSCCDNQAAGFAGAAWVFVNAPPPPIKPSITSIMNGAGFATGVIASGSWVSLFGTGLAPVGDSRTWNPTTEITSGKFPISLDGTSVTINGKSAAVEFIQPAQINIQTPDDTAIGPVQVVVNTAAGATSSFTANYATFAPGLFTANSTYLVAQHTDDSYVSAVSPAKPGEVITLWGTGFGPANPPVPAGQVFSGANLLANAVTVTIGGQPAPLDYAGVVGAGLVQINVHVPISISNGDATVLATVGGVSTQTTANMLPFHN